MLDFFKGFVERSFSSLIVFFPLTDYVIGFWSYYYVFEKEFCGIDFKNKKISDDAKFGGIKVSKLEKLFQEFEQNKLMDLISSFQS